MVYWLYPRTKLVTNQVDSNTQPAFWWAGCVFKKCYKKNILHFFLLQMLFIKIYYDYKKSFLTFSLPFYLKRKIIL